MKKFVENLKDKNNWKKAFKVSLTLFAIKEIIGIVLMVMGLV